MNEKVNGIEVELKSHFNVVRETLERVGIVNKKTNTLYPSCYLLHKKNKYYIIHFKNLFLLDGRKSNYDEQDNLRQTAIAKLMERWGLVDIVSKENVVESEQYPFLFVLSHEQKDKFKIEHKYTIGTIKG